MGIRTTAVAIRLIKGKSPCARERFFRPFGARLRCRLVPRLAPWASFLRRYAAGGALDPLRRTRSVVMSVVVVQAAVAAFAFLIFRNAFEQVLAAKVGPQRRSNVDFRIG